MSPNTLIPSYLMLAAVAVTTTLSIPAQASTSKDDHIPTQLLNSPEDGDLNGPCSLCQVSSIKAAEDLVGSRSTLEIYFDDERGELSGYIELTILLDSGELHTLTIENVTLPYRQTVVFELPTVEDWEWTEDVRHLWVEPIPTDPIP